MLRLLHKATIYFKPKLLEWKNKLASERAQKNFLLSIGFTFALGLLFYMSGLAAVIQIEKQESSALDVKTILEVIMHYYFYVIFIAGALAAMNSLYTTKSLEFILSRKVNYIALFIGKVLEVALSTAWFSLIVGLPILLIIYSVHDSGTIFLLSGGILIFALHLLASAASILGGLIVGPLIRPAVIRKALLILALLFGFAFFAATSQQKLVLNAVTSFDIENLNLFVPLKLSWVSYCNNLLLSLADPIEYALLLKDFLFFLAWFVFIFGLNQLAFQYFYLWFYELSQEKNSQFSKHNQPARCFTRLAMGNSRFRAIYLKEILSFERDSLNIVQLSVLLGVVCVYLFSLLNRPMFEGWPLVLQEWGTAGLLLINMLSILMIVAILSARFVFTTISLEGQAFWIYRSSPLSLKEYLAYKENVWQLLIGLLATLALVISNQLIANYDPYTFLNTLAGLIVSYGIIGLGIGMGAYFANFKWESLAELTGSFGNFLYLICSVTLIAFSLIPIAFLIMLCTLIKHSADISVLELTWHYTVLLSALFYFSYIVRQLALRIGIRQLA